MSLLVGSYREFMTFEQWLLSEAVEPVKVEYGSNPPEFNDRVIARLPNNVNSTCFVYNDSLYAIQLNDLGEVAFGVNFYVPNSEEELRNITFSDKIVKSVYSNGLKVFNQVFYVLLEMLSKDNRDVYFQSANEDLEHFYNKLLGNKFFNRRLNTIGYSDMFLEDGLYKINYKR